MKTFSMTHVGQRRETNQDYMYTSETSVGRLPDLFLVADGMGAVSYTHLTLPTNREV